MSQFSENKEHPSKEGFWLNTFWNKLRISLTFSAAAGKRTVLSISQAKHFHLLEGNRKHCFLDIMQTLAETTLTS